MKETLISFRDLTRVLKDNSFNAKYALEDGIMMGFQKLGEVVGGRVMYPVRFDGLVIAFFLKGNVRVDINVNSYSVEEGSLLIIAPGNMVRFHLPEEVELSQFEVYYLILSKEFVDSLSTITHRNAQDRLKLYSNPCYRLTAEDRSVARDYFNLTRKIMFSSLKNRKEIIMGLVSSMSFYDSSARIVNPDSPVISSDNTPRKADKTFETFLALASEYHVRERGLTFYAKKMSLSRKYLGRVVKKVSGRKGTDWINDMVIMEAKSLLKFSDKAIKEIVINLNFANQSVFYKYFKAHTGMTPSEYRSSK